MSEIPTPIWVKFRKSLTHFGKDKKQLLLGIIIGMLFVAPFTMRPYQNLETEFLVSDDLVVYNDLYLFYFDEIGNAKINDMVATIWFNVTTAQYVLISIYFEENTQVKRIGIMYHDGGELLKDIKSPSEGILIQLEDIQKGIFSCTVFFVTGNNSLIDVSVFYLS